MAKVESGNIFIQTPKGIRADVKIYLYPDGHGNVVNGKLSRPFSNTVEAILILERLINEGLAHVSDK